MNAINSLLIKDSYGSVNNEAKRGQGNKPKPLRYIFFAYVRCRSARQHTKRVTQRFEHHQNIHTHMVMQTNATNCKQADGNARKY